MYLIQRWLIIVKMVRKPFHEDEWIVEKKFSHMIINFMCTQY
jgi:hypothetical protein